MRDLGERAVLVVDDEAGIRSLMAAILQSYGFRTVEAADGASALQMISQTGDCLDLLVTDIRMPGEIDGKALAVRAREMYPELPVVLVSGYTDHGGSLEPGFKFVQKPFRPAALLEAVSEVLRTGKSGSVSP